MSKITVISSATRKETVTEGSQVILGDASVVKIQAGRGEIYGYTRSGNDLLVKMTDGQTVTLKNYFVNSHELVLDENGSLWWIEEPLAVERYQQVPSTDALLSGSVTSSSNDNAIWPWVLGGLAAAGGIALAAGGGGGGGGGDDRVDPGPAPQDTTPPAAPTNLRFSADATQLLGNAEPNSGITITDADGNVIGKTITNGNGEFTVELGTPYTNGETLTATATDGSGNVSPETTITAADTTAPDAPSIIIADDDVGSITGSLADNQTTDDPRPTFTGSGEPGAKITIYDNGVAIGTVMVTADGSWTFTPTADLSDGFHQLTATATDTAGNVGPESPVFSITIDTLAPNPPAVQVIDNEGTSQGIIAAGAFIDADQPELTGTGEIGSTIAIYDNGELLAEVDVAANGTWSFTPTEPLAEGVHSLTLTETDLAGNTSALSAPFTFTVDLTAPAVPSAIVTGDGTQVNGTAEPNATVSVSNSLGEDLGTTKADVNGVYTITLTTAQVDGQTLNVVAEDAAGNQSEPGSAVAPDITPPDAPTELVVAQAGGTLTGVAEVGARIAVMSAGGDVLGTGTVGDDGKFSIYLAQRQVNGETLDVFAWDHYENKSPPGKAGAFDTTAPLRPGDLALSQDGLKVTGVAEPGSTVIIREGTVEVGRVTAGDNGGFSVLFPLPKKNGEEMLFTATDKAGNVSPESMLTAPDTTPPAKPIITNVIDDVLEGLGTIPHGTLTNDRAPLITGTGEIGTKIFIYSGTHQIGLAEVGADGTWSYQVNAHLTNGIHDLSADAVDRRENHSPRSDIWTIEVDPASPGVPGTPVETPAATPQVATLASVEPLAVESLTHSDSGETVIYHVLDSTAGNATGGNSGSDHLSDFSLADGDKIDISELLVGWDGDRATLGNYIQVSGSDGNTLISIDRDGTGTSYAPTPLVTLDDVQTTYEELVSQNHIVTG
ncbi:MAG: Ig-like domain-containing protein [Leclercia sp.]